MVEKGKKERKRKEGGWGGRVEDGREGGREKSSGIKLLPAVPMVPHFHSYKDYMIKLTLLL